MPTVVPWNGWYHCITHTYGSWLRGDPRGWRARHHREHVEGDYKNPPPPGTYRSLHAYSKSLMNRDPVRIQRELRTLVLKAAVDRLRDESLDVVVASLDGNHLHVLARFPAQNPRHFMGLAKKHSALEFRRECLDAPPGGLWAKRGKEKPIADRSHQIQVVRYILSHATRGAVTCLVSRGS